MQYSNESAKGRIINVHLIPTDHRLIHSTIDYYGKMNITRYNNQTQNLITNMECKRRWN